MYFKHPWRGRASKYPLYGVKYKVSRNGLMYFMKDTLYLLARMFGHKSRILGLRNKSSTTYGKQICPHSVSFLKKNYQAVVGALGSILCKIDINSRKD